MSLLPGRLQCRTLGWFLIPVAGLLCPLSPARAQEDPAAAQDALIERQKVMKAADQLDLIVQQNAQLQQDLAQMKERVKKLETDNAELKRLLDEQAKAQARDKEALLKEVSKIVAAGSKETKPVKEAKTDAPATGSKSGDSAAAEQGYEYTVLAGQSLWAISKAYQEKGVNVSVEDIRKANNLAPNQPLKTGQKLFIPKK